MTECIIKPEQMIKPEQIPKENPEERVKAQGKGTLVRFRDDERGIGVVEMILILVVLIALVLIFKEQLTTLVGTIFSQITKSAKSVYN